MKIRWHLRAALAAAIVAIAAAGAARAVAQEHERHIPMILSPASGATVSSPVTVVIGTQAQGDEQGGGHPHHGPRAFLIIDAPAPGPGAPISPDAQHVAFPEGQMQMAVALSPGQHQLQLAFVDRDGVVPRHFHPGAPVAITVR